MGYVEIVVVDKKGRIVIPSRIRKRLNLKSGDSLFIMSVRDDIIVLKKIDVEKVLRDIAREVAASRLDLDEIAREVEEEANRVAKEKIPARH